MSETVLDYPRAIVPQETPRRCTGDGCTRQPVARPPASLADAFRRYPVEDGEHGCIEWRGPSVHDGYGTMSYKGKRYAHRVAYRR